MGIELPEWTKHYYPDKLTALSAYSLKMNVGNDILKRLAGGPFIKKAVVKMQAKASGHLKPEKRKMFAYIAHDSTIINVLVAMGVWDDEIPDFSAMIIIELHEINGNWNVQVSYSIITINFIYFFSITINFVLFKFVSGL